MSIHSKNAIGLLAIACLLLTACGEDLHPTLTSPAPTMSLTSGLRPRDQWTIDSPATLAEIEAELQRFRGQTLTFVSWGGAYQTAQHRAYIEPFEESFGIDIIEDQPPSLIELQFILELGDITWHVLDFPQSEVLQLGADGYFEELDFSIIDNRRFIDSAKSAWGAGGGITWSTVLVYNSNVYPEGFPDMSAYFDPVGYPGKRAWVDGAGPQELFALIGENPSLLDTLEGRQSLYSLSEEQLDHAYQLMDSHRSQVETYWSGGVDCRFLIGTAEIDISTCWNGRVFDAQQDGAPITICWHCGHLVQTDTWVIPKGLSDDPDQFYLAQLFMAWASFPERNVELTRYISYGPVNLDSIPLLSDESFDHVRDHLPTSPTNLQYAIFQDEQWASETAISRAERYLEWQQGF